MKILFSNPPWWHVAEHAGNPVLFTGVRCGSRWPFTRPALHGPDDFKFGGYLPFPFFLSAAAAYTAHLLPEAQVEIRDSIARGESYSAFFIHLGRAAPDWLVLETATPSWDHDAKLIDELGARLPSMRVILAGTIDATKAGEIRAAHPNVVAIVQGEYDAQIARVVRGELAGLVPHRLLTKAELDAAPLPMFDEAAALNYWDACPAGQQPPQLQFWTSRGCPFKCCFCVWPATMTGNDPDGTKPRAVRCYSPQWVDAFLTYRLGVARANGTPYKTLYVDDDTFNLTEKHTRAICDVLRKHGLPWSAMCRADTISREAWQLMKDSGCFGVKIGFESGSQQVIDRIVNKRLDLAKGADTARWLRSIGLTVHGTFTVGLPGETEAQKQETLAFIRDLYASGGLDTHQLSGTAEIEGTPLHTLRSTGHLEKYPDAHLGAGYLQSADGASKLREMFA